MYIDTEKTIDQYLSSQLIKNMCGRFGVDYDSAISDYLLIYNPATVDDLEDFIKLKLTDLVISGNARVIIVDSITALYRANSGVGRSWPRGSSDCTTYSTGLGA